MCESLGPQTNFLWSSKSLSSMVLHTHARQETQHLLGQGPPPSAPSELLFLILGAPLPKLAIVYA